MRSAHAGWLRLMALATVAALAVAGCATDQETINRVQPNALKKTVLDGDWYYLQTVIDTPASTGYTFVGDQGEVKKIRWEIQEEYLVARRTYEHIAGAEDEGPDPVNDAKSTTMAMYKITSHFDVRREYNPATGEETNVVAENDVDRPWHEREFMRVDWSQNLVTDGDFMLFARIFDGIETESVSYFVQNGPDAPRFESSDGKGVDYIDIVNKMFVKPTEITYPGLGKVPTCLLSSAPQLCEPGEISVRNSFRKVVDRDYQPILYTGDRMQRFGYFVDERPGYSADYGTVESERFRFAQRHNLWMQSHRRNEQNQLVGCGADADCAEVAGSKCDVAWGQARRRYNENGDPQGVCTLPYRDREVRPVVYYMSASTPEDLQGDADTLANEWNRAFAETVASLRENECLEAKGSNCAAERERDKKVFHVCTTPVKAGAPAACGEEGFTPRPGDLRYSQLIWVSSEENGGPLGYGPGHSDPETGELLMGNAYIYGAAMDRAATQARDIVMVLNGDLDVEDVQAGDYISSLIDDAHEREGESALDGDAIPMTPELLAQSVKAMDFSWASGDFVRGKPRDLAEFVQGVKKARDGLYHAGAFGNGTDEGAARLSRLKGTDLEAMLITPEMRMAAGLDPFDTTLDESVLEAASPLRGRSLDSLRAVEKARQVVREKVGYYDAEFEDEGLIGFALQIKQAGSKAGGAVEWYGKKYELNRGGRIDYDAVRAMIRHPMFHGLALHEIGHSVGLRHNFSGSFDALNYKQQYWKIRDDGKMAPRLWDPMTDAEKSARIREYQYSTVMDYGQNFIVSDAVGLGHYDIAAIKMGYGDLVEVFTAVPPANVERVVGAALIQQLGYPFMLDVQALEQGEVRANNYTDWPAMLGGIANLEKRADVPYKSLKAGPVRGFEDPAVDQQGRPAVPFMFCSDEQADLNPDCMRYDAGADPFESVKSVVDSYWYYYPFISFRRQRLGFDVGPTVDRIHNRYFEKIKRAHQIYALYRPIFSDLFGLAQDAPFWEDQRGMGSWSAAATLGFDLLRHVITAPEPGTYGSGKQPDGQEVLTPASSTLFVQATVDALDGRYLETTWDFDAGYFWFDQLDRVGYFYDKAFALLTLVDPTTYFVGRDTDADIRKYQLNYATSFGPAMTALFRSVLAEDWRAIAPRGNAQGQVRYPSIDQMMNGSMGEVPLLPNVSFSIQLYAALWGMGYIPQTYDQSFLQSSRMWIEGGAEEVELDPSVPVVTFTDPDSLLTYTAISFVDGGGKEQGVAAAMINYANAILARADGADGVFGNEDDDPAGTQALRSYVDNLDLVRRLTWELGFGAQP